MKILVVDENDTPIGLKERSEIIASDLYRVSALWLTNSKGEILIAQRALTKSQNPGAWGPAVAGTVEEGEDYDTNIIKETEEELGMSLPLSDLRKGPKYRRPRFFCQWYFATRDVQRETLHLQADEVMDAKWISPADLRRWIEKQPEDFVGAMPGLMDAFLR